MDVTFFKDITELRQWLINNHLKEEELWVGYYKKHTKKYNFSWADSVDQYLCFGWIDGLRRSIDDERYKIRITPRKPNSNWSAVNLKKIKELTAKNLMYPAGIEIFNMRNPEKSDENNTDNKPIPLADEYEQQFKKNIEAWRFFMTLTPSIKRLSINYIMKAKRKDTQLRRLELVIRCSAKHEKIPHLTWKPKKIN